MTSHTISYSAAGSKSLKKPCGCGGGCGGTPCECPGCKCGHPCGCSEGLLIQPHFFAGQLLTDDDLQALTNYVITKQRLHNRFVVGSGVACGLAVTCHPCGHGKVMVQPGYAIDCCGNDIFVPCPVELDINAMVRDLKFRRLGVDCGDPCDEHPSKNNNGQKKIGIERHADPCDEPVNRYCVYLVYCESPTDPVAPYTSDESCSAACQPSRMREGYRFELRCPEKEEPPPSWLDRIRCCLGDLMEADLHASKLERAQSQMQPARLALRAYAEHKQAPFTDEDVKLISRAKIDDHGLLSLEGDAVKVQFAKAASDQKNEASGSQEFTEAMLRRSLDNVQTLGSAIARYLLLDERQRKTLRDKSEEFAAKIDNAQELLKAVLADDSNIRKKLEQLTSPIELAAAKATVDNTLKYVVQPQDPKQLQSFEGNLYCDTTWSSKALNAQYQSSLGNLKDWLLRRMHDCPPTTECSLVCDTASVVIPADDSFSDALIVAIDALVRALLRYLLDCICSALLPSCPTCEDPAVKLACLEVKDCKVDNICNLERTFLITGPNLRYWLPFLHWLGQALEKICCECSKKLDRPILNPGDFEPELTYFTSGAQPSKSLEAQPAYINILRLVGLAPSTASPAINVGSNLAHIVWRQPQITCFYGQQAKVDVAMDTGSTLLAQVFEHPLAQETLQIAANQQLGKIEAHVEALAAERFRAAEELHDPNQHARQGCGSRFE